MASVVASDVIERNLLLRIVLGIIQLIGDTKTTLYVINATHPIFDKGITIGALLDIINRAFKNDSVVVHLTAS